MSFYGKTTDVGLAKVVLIDSYRLTPVISRQQDRPYLYCSCSYYDLRLNLGRELSFAYLLLHCGSLSQSVVSNGAGYRRAMSSKTSFGRI